MKRVLITGKSGYIATALQQAFQGKYELTCIGQSDFNLSNREITNNWFKDKQFDVVIHTAAIICSRLKPDTLDILDVNLKMFFNLLSNKDKYTKFITFGSGAELGNPESYYGMSKNIISRHIDTEINFFNIRIYGVFNENELDTRFIKASIISYIGKRPIVIHEDRIMDFFYMGDLNRLVRYYIESVHPSKQVNCTYKEKYTLHDIARKINSLSNYTVPIIFVKPTTGSDYTGSSNLPIQTLGIDTGIQNSYNALSREGLISNI